MSLARVRAIAFDLDGTLIDSRLDLAEAVNRARGDLGLGHLEVDDILGMVGEGALSLVRRALGGDPEAAQIERAFAAFQRHYDAVCVDRTASFAGIDELLVALAGHYPLAVLTNKPERFASRIVAHLGWSSRFQRLIGGDTLASRKPDPEGLSMLASGFGVGVENLLLVGDSRIDRETARAAGAPFVFVEWGFAGEEERQALRAERRIRFPHELRGLLA